MTDAELVDRARAGDSSAFGTLIERHQHAVYRAALAALGSPADAEDAAQDAFVVAHERLKSFRGDASFRTWLLTLAWNHALNRRRSLVRWWRRAVEFSAVHSGEKAVVLQIVSTAPSPEEELSRSRLRREIAREIRRLPAKLRDASLLAQSQEYSYAEIAAMLAAPIGTIKWRVSEARKLLKKRLEEHGYVNVRN